MYLLQQMDAVGKKGTLRSKQTDRHEKKTRKGHRSFCDLKTQYFHAYIYIERPIGYWYPVYSLIGVQCADCRLYLDDVFRVLTCSSSVRPSTFFLLLMFFSCVPMAVIRIQYEQKRGRPCCYSC